MFKYAYKFVVQSRLFQCLGESDVVRTIHVKKRKISIPKCFRQMSFIRQNKNNIRSAVCDKKPGLLLSGVLSYLGLAEKTAEEKESDIILHIKKGILLTEQEDYHKAEVTFHLALQLAQEQHDEDAITYIYDMLANLAFERNQDEKARKLFVNVLQRLMANGEKEDSKKVVHISLKLAKIFHNAKEYKKAEQGYLFCIDTMEKQLPGGDEDTLGLWGMCVDWYAKFLLDTNNKAKALEFFKKAYEVCVRVNGERHEQTVVLLNDIGTVSSLMGDSDSAIKYFEKARDIGQHLPDMRDLASIYVNLGHVYLLREMYEESRSACEEGMRTAQNSNDEIGLSEARHCLENIEKVFSSSHGSKELKHFGLSSSGSSSSFDEAEFIK